MAGAPAALTIRSMQPADLQETLDVWVAAWQVAYPAIDFNARRGWTADRIAELERTGSRSLIALKDGSIVGALVVNPETGYLDQIVVAADHQGSGVAEILLSEARRLSPTKLDLHVNQDNSRAIRFYQKHGFAISGEALNWRSGAPVHRMSWRP